MLLDHLPRTSHLRQAMATDVDLYRATGGPDRPRLKPPAPPLTEYSPEVELLAAMFDRLGEVAAILARLGGSKRRARLRPWARPETAEQLHRRQQRREAFEHLESVIRYVE